MKAILPLLAIASLVLASCAHPKKEECSSCSAPADAKTVKHVHKH